ncbi:MAG TPA: glycosyltransferase family 39 protein, partial [Chloroflexia bacterium]|nr:glycosyltransferase family 39 protein [Chloroflexia bacterium]
MKTLRKRSRRNGTQIPPPNTPPAAPALPPSGPYAAGRARAAPYLRAGLALGAAALAAAAESLAAAARSPEATAPPLLSWGLFGLAALLLAAATWPGRALWPALPPAWRAVGRARGRQATVVVPLALAVAGGLVAIPLFSSLIQTPSPQAPANTGAWLVWIAALLCFGGACVAWESGSPQTPEGDGGDPPGDGLPARLEWAILAGLLGLALLLRLPSLDDLPPGLWFDEAQNGLVAQQIVAPGALHPVFLGDFTQMGGLYFYGLGLVLRLFGAGIWPLRLIPALSGALLAPLLYLLAARLYGWRAGLAAGGLVAVSAWNLTFSRFGIASLPTVALDVGVYLCAVQALRTGRLGYYAGAGVLLGLALHAYYVARLVPLVLVAVLLHQLLTVRWRLVRALPVGLAVFALGAGLAFLPMALLALQQPALFGGRIDQVSIFNPTVAAGDPLAFQHNLTKHLLMFNFVGDGNGRHNLPGAPMLDDVTAALFFLGLGSCLLRAWRWQYFFPCVWFVAALSGGVLSLPFEAPQSHRTLENSVVTALLAGIALGDLWRLGLSIPWPFRAGARRAPPPVRAAVPVRQAGRPGIAAATAVPGANRPGRRNYGGARLASAAGVLAVVGWAASSTIPRYFVDQAHSRSVWEDMNAPQLAAAR